MGKQKSLKGAPGKRRKKGDWIAIAAGRKNKDFALPTTRGLSNDPPKETGSAAYRRLQRGKQQVRH